MASQAALTRSPSPSGKREEFRATCVYIGGMRCACPLDIRMLEAHQQEYALAFPPRRPSVR